MRTIWHSLAWKEWHEHKWKLASLTAITLSMSFYWLVREPTAVLMAVYVTLMPYVIFGSAFVAMGTVAGEPPRGTMPFLRALPVQPWKVAMNKLALGFATALLPMLVTIGLAYGWYCISTGSTSVRHADLYEQRVALGFLNADNWLLGSTMMAIFGIGSLYLWAVAAGVNRRDEVRAGAMALAVFVGWWIVLSFVATAWWDWDHWVPSWLSAIAIGAAPGGLFFLADYRTGYMSNAPAAVACGIVSAAATHLGLAGWFVWRYSRAAVDVDRSPHPAAVETIGLSALAAPRQSAWSALAWKQYRESGPLVLASLAGIVGWTTVYTVAVVASWSSARQEAGIYESTIEFTYRFADILVKSGQIFGVLAVMIVGIGLFASDLTPKLNAFWRSRPVSTSLWFWTKYLTGLLLLFVVLELPIAAICLSLGHWTILPIHLREFWLWFGYHGMVYSTAVAVMCLTRQPVYAGIFTLAGLGAVAIAAERINVLPHHQYQLVPLIGTAIVAVFIAWQAVRRDWGWKR